MSRIRDRKTDTNYFRLKLKTKGNSKTRTYLNRVTKLLNTTEIKKRAFNAMMDELLYGINIQKVLYDLY